MSIAMVTFPMFQSTCGIYRYRYDSCELRVQSSLGAGEKNEGLIKQQLLLPAALHNEINDDNLYVVALRFRLVRQQGHYMSSDVFEQFTDHDGKFKKTLINDVQGLSMVPILTKSLKVQMVEGCGSCKQIAIYRDKLVELYGQLGCIYTSLQYSRCETTSKVFNMISTNDDTYDAYATLNELVLYSDAIQKWDISAMDSLPPYMRPLYQVNLDIFSGNGRRIGQRRLMDDIIDHEVQQERGHAASIIECYMKEYGASKEEAYTKYRKEVKNAWKDINKALMRPTEVPMFVLERPLNLARLLDTLFKDEDGYKFHTNVKPYYHVAY
ncbi:hypothetical protein HAX54_013513 [Datura stramonium]|uniref:Uncharacterized protein n=1 Tax=Datura stramonium TaxID=4076 RepID=A0ABS8TLD5_DATST|nr:hypothetical protein [Datura stramonium]